MCKYSFKVTSYTQPFKYGISARCSFQAHQHTSHCKNTVAVLHFRTVNLIHPSIMFDLTVREQLILVL